MNNEELARQYDERLAEGREFDGLVPVKARVAKDVRATTSVRLTPAELTEIVAAAKKRDLTMSDFIRQAALAAARGELDLSSAEAVSLEELATRMDEVSATVRRLARR